MRGIKIIDISRVLAGPWATQQLADQGATVIKVEPPKGDETRQFGPHSGDTSTYYLSANRNKRSIAIDLKVTEGQAVLHQLLEDADVIIENFRPGVAKRLGLDWSALHQQYPNLIYVAIHAFGLDSPPQWQSRPGYDLVLQAMGGAMASTGQPDGPPQKCANSIADISAAMMAVQSILLALLHRERTGESQKVVVNMMQTQAAVAAYHMTRFNVLGTVDGQRGNSHAALAPYNTYRCSDGWIAIAVGNDDLWRRLVSVLALPVSPHWATNRQRVEHRESVDSAISEAIAHKTVADADAILSDAGVPCGPVNTYAQVANHPAVQTISTDHEGLGPLTMVGPTMTTLSTRQQHTPPPRLSEHAKEIMNELAIDADDQERLFASGAVTRPPDY